MKVKVKPFIGQHCESTATGTLLNQIGIELSEPMLFGLGEGLSFIYWNMKNMDFPFLGGRVKPDLLTSNITRNLGLHLLVNETSSTTKAWDEVQQHLDGGRAVGLKLDCYHLDYFTNPFHFAGHYVAIIGYDSGHAILVDTAQQGSEVTTSLKSLELARNEKGPMSSRNRSYLIEQHNHELSLKDAVQQAIQSNAQAYLNPAIKNLGFKGIEKASIEVVKWFDRSANTEAEFANLAMLMEKAGTGGALFRNLYRDFLLEAYQLTGRAGLAEANQKFTEIARIWTEVSALFEKAAATGERLHVLQASKRLQWLSQEEKHAMELLQAI